MIRMIMDGKTYTFGLLTFKREQALVSSVKYHRTAKTKKHLRVWLPDRDIWIDPMKVSVIEHKPVEHEDTRAMKAKKDEGIHDCANCDGAALCPLPPAAEYRAKMAAKASPPAKDSFNQWLQSEAAKQRFRAAFVILEGGEFDPVGLN